MSVVVCTDSDANLAQRTADWGSRFLWSQRRQFVYKQTPLAKALQQAKRIKDGPIILLDHGDNCMSGGTCDTVDAPRTALELGLAALLVGPTCDPGAVQACVKAGVGARIKLKIGGNTPMPRAGVRRPVKLNVTATIRAISDGQYTVSGPIFNGSTQHMGTSAFVSFGSKQEHGVVLTTNPHEPLDLGCFTSLGVTMDDYRYWMLKSRMYYQPVFAPLAKQVIACASAGATSSDYAPFKFTQVRRPVYPLNA